MISSHVVLELAQLLDNSPALHQLYLRLFVSCFCVLGSQRKLVADIVQVINDAGYNDRPTSNNRLVSVVSAMKGKLGCQLM